MLDRAIFGYVVGVDGVQITLNLRSEHRGSVASHRNGVCSLLETGSLFGVVHGTDILVLRVSSLQFAEPREVHHRSKNYSQAGDEPLRHLHATSVGRLIRQDSDLYFLGDALSSPVLGAEAFPLNDRETQAIYCCPPDDSPSLTLGECVRGNGKLRMSLNRLLPRHVAVLGGTGQGKSCFTASMLQQMVLLPHSRIVVFDINGEYEDALSPKCKPGDLKVTRIGKGANDGDHGFKIPYYALGRDGLARLFLPSEKAQRPAFQFAFESLPFVECDAGGVKLVGADKSCLIDVCKKEGADKAIEAMEKLRNRVELRKANRWPPMSVITALIAEGECLKRGKDNSADRDGRQFSNVSPLLNRIRRRIDDPMFCKVVDVKGGQEIIGDNSETAVNDLINDLFGTHSTAWKIHVVDMRQVANDLLPSILGALLELYASRLFTQVQANAFPTLLVLEEAHHYLRSVTEEEGSRSDTLAYERLAKEGRKFGLSLWVSTQRPSEVSGTVLSQCGTWVCFRVTGTSDTNAISAATEWLDRRELAAISGLPRQQALFFGASIPFPTRLAVPDANPLPRSHDPEYGKWNHHPAPAAQARTRRAEPEQPTPACGSVMNGQ